MLFVLLDTDACRSDGNRGSWGKGGGGLEENAQYL